MEHLIANSGLQFYSTEVEFNPQEPCRLQSGKTLKYAFAEITDLITETKSFDILYAHPDGCYIPAREIHEMGLVEMLPNGNDEWLDDAGCIKLKEGESISLFSTFQDDDASVMTINSLSSYRVRSYSGRSQESAFELLLGHWLPMPMFERRIDGVSFQYPTAWCRVKIVELGEGTQKGMRRFRLIWAFDTQLGDLLSSNLRPAFEDDETGSRIYSLCNRTELLIAYCFNEDGSLSPFAQHIASLLRVPVEKMLQEHEDQVFKFVGYYIYLINYLRTMNFAPEITLFKDAAREIPTDLVLDIGNSRTCGVLFEEGDSRKARQLELRDLSQPWKVYNSSFDMRIVFRKADFGNDIVLEENLFNWPSFVRLGNEARNLVYRATQDKGLRAKTTNYSSPKRYLWDSEPFEGQWMFLTTVDDPFNVRSEENIYIDKLTEYFDAAGNYRPEDFNELSNHYSRASLMTFVMIEILQQALMQINSEKYRERWGNIDCRRYLRNVIITCPTAMPRIEQVRLRQAAVDAYDVMRRANPDLKPITFSPSIQSLKITDDTDESGKRQWYYDEATCSQLVYLFAELNQRYNGEARQFFEAKGHIRPEFKEEGYSKKSLTIGSVDIGAGTTDLMICAYQQIGENQGKLKPIPKFWDSYYLAGDDILHSIVQNIVIEGPMRGSKTEGSIASVTMARLKSMSNEELIQLPIYSNPDEPLYHNKIDNVLRAFSDEMREERLKDLGSSLVRGMFGVDAAFLDDRGRHCRLDFNTQISVPIAQKMMDLVRQKIVPRRLTFDDIFTEVRPAGYLLDYFEQHFGYRFEEIVWTYDPEMVNKELRSTMESLMKQLAVILHAYHCDIIVLSGRPTSLAALPELFVKHYPITPDRLIRLEDYPVGYRVGEWYPFADQNGYFSDCKSVVAVGAMVGFLASTQGFDGMVLDFSEMIKLMKPTTAYVGTYNTQRQRVVKTLLSPETSSAQFTATVFPYYIGCRQLDSIAYQARPFYAIVNNSKYPSLQITISRQYLEDREKLYLEEVTDEQGNNVPKNQVKLVPQSLVDDGKYWLDKGEFILSLK